MDEGIRKQSGEGISENFQWDFACINSEIISHVFQSSYGNIL